MTEIQGQAASTVSQAQAETLWRQALARHEAGSLHEAVLAYRNFLAIWPDHVGALCNLGMLHCQMGAADAALPLLEEATRVAPEIAETHANLGQALKQLGRPQAALESYRQAANLQANNPWCHFNLAVVLHQVGQSNEALASYREAIRLAPNLPSAHNNLGKLQWELGQTEAALDSYRTAQKLSPGYFEAHFNHGKALSAMGKTEAAASALSAATAMRPDDSRAYNDLGVELLKLGRPSAAAAAFERLIEQKPDSWEAHCNLGSALGRMDEQAKAIACFERALQLRPDASEVLCNLGVALKSQGRYDEAVVHLQRAVELRPEFKDAQNNLGLVLKDVGQPEAALACFQQVLAMDPEHHEAHSNLLFTLNLLPDRAPADMLEQARAFGDKVAASATPYRTWQMSMLPDKCLRVGLVSGDLRNHPVGFFLEGILSALDAGQIELVAYASHHPVDDLTDRLKPRFSQWRMVAGMSDEFLARLIHEDGIDILIDLAGHTGFNRLPMFAWKPAPVQVTWLGYFATTGVPGMDYLLADPQVAPADEAAHFSEKLWRLPEIYYCFTPPEVPLQVAPAPAIRLGHITFGCFNKLAKMNEDVVQVWSRVLHALPEAKLMLKAKELGDAAQRASVLQRYARHGITPGRLILEGVSPRAEYLAAYRQVDIALDPFPYPGGTTTVEGLWMGVPALTLKGDRFIGHQGETILHNAGLADWIARDEEDYVARAVAFAGDVAALSELRASLREQLLASPVCDAPRFARNFETALRGMWRQRCESTGTA